MALVKDRSYPVTWRSYVALVVVIIAVACIVLLNAYSRATGKHYGTYAWRCTPARVGEVCERVTESLSPAAPHPPSLTPRPL